MIENVSKVYYKCVRKCVRFLKIILNGYVNIESRLEQSPVSQIDNLCPLNG
jgi:hypothetical protein